jgi:hypothetical protein
VTSRYTQRSLGLPPEQPCYSGSEELAANGAVSRDEVNVHQPRRNHDPSSRWSAGSARKTIHGTNTTVNTSVRSARGQCAISGPPMRNLRSGEPHEKGERRVDREPDDYGELPARGHAVVLRCARPADKSLGNAFARSSPAEDLGQSRGGKAIGGIAVRTADHLRERVSSSFMARFGSTRTRRSKARSSRRSPALMRALTRRRSQRQ